MNVTVLVRDGEHAQRLIGTLTVPHALVTDDRSVNKAAKKADSEWLWVLDHADGPGEQALEAMVEIGWDADIVYPNLYYALTREPYPSQYFDSGRMTLEHYLPRVALIRRQAFLEAGGLKKDGWYGLFWRLRDKRWKLCRYATVMVDQPDPQPDTYKGPEPDFKATFYCQATPATVYLRCEQPARYLPGLLLMDPHWAESEDDYFLPWQRGPVAVMQYAADKYRDLARHLLQAKGVKVLLEVDDNYLVPAKGFMKQNMGWGDRIGEKAHTFAGHRVFAEGCDGVIATTVELAKKYRKLGKRAWVCPNQVEPADWPTPGPKGDVFRIGWFASPSHAADAKLVTRGLEWASRQDGVQVVTMGISPPSWRFPRVALPWNSDPSAYRETMQVLDVGVCPVVPNPWSVCRSDVKALEYATGSVLPIMSDVPPYHDWWPGKPGLFATDAKDFLHKIKWAVQHQDEARQLGRECREQVLKERTAEGNVWRYEEAFSEVTA